MPYEAIRSPHLEIVRSPHLELDGGPPAPFSLTFDTMQNSKVWPGTTAAWLNQRGMSANILKLVPDRQSFRKRYANAFLSTIYGIDIANYPGGPSTAMTWDLSGPGSTPVPAGTPPFAWLLGPIPPAWFNDVGTPLNQFYTNFFGDIHSPSYTTGYTSASRQGYIYAAGPRPYYDSASAGLSNEVVFNTQLALATNRVNARTWPAFLPYSTNHEVFGEYSNLWSASFTDSTWHNVTGGTTENIADYNPYFGGVNSTADCRGLWTGWIWPQTQEETPIFVDFPYTASGLLVPILAQRTRFRCSQALPYFIATATINRVAGWGPVIGGISHADTIDSLDNVTVTSSGITIPNATYEIPWPSSDPGATDFVQTQLKTIGAATLSIGSCCFAIVGETPDQWHARTGF